MSKNLIVKDNALINASYNLELIEQRLILLAIAQSRRTGVSVDKKMKISVADYIDIYSIEGRSVYENIKKACKTLFERQFTYHEKEVVGVRVATSRWVSEIAYNDETSTVDLIFAPSVAPLITLLERQFTSYDLEQVAGLNSKYAVRLYEIVVAWRSQGNTPQMAVQELRERLGVLDDEYQLMADFKKRVLDKSVTEINKATDITLSYEQHKHGRKIVGFTFTFTTKAIAKPKQIKTPKTTTPKRLEPQTEAEQKVVADKLAYANQKDITDPLHIQNLINDGITKHRQAEKVALEQREREQAHRKAQKAKDKADERLALQQFEQILASDELIQAYITANKITEKRLSGLQKVRFMEGDFRDFFRMEKHNFEKIHFWRRLKLDFLGETATTPTPTTATEAPKKPTSEQNTKVPTKDSLAGQTSDGEPKNLNAIWATYTESEQKAIMEYVKWQIETGGITDPNETKALKIRAIIEKLGVV